MPAPDVFKFVYDVDFNPTTGRYHVLDNNSNPAVLGALKHVVTTTDNIVDPGGDDPSKLGDVAGDHFTLSKAGGLLDLNGVYTFVTRAQLGGGLQGFIIQSDGGQYFFVTNNQIKLQGNAPGAARLLTPEAGAIDICFMPGTRIAVPVGEILIEDLRIGDPVLTVDGREVPIRWIGRQTVCTWFRDEVEFPIRIRASALDEGVPCRDLLVSPDHAIFIDGVLVQAGALVNGTSIIYERNVPETFVYYHVELDDHSLILAENTPAETFIDNVDRARFDNWQEYQTLYPDAAAAMEMAFPRAKSRRQLPRVVRERIARRVAALPEGRIVAAA